MTLFAPFTLRGVPLRNRVVVSPMSQYRAQDGVANDWHLVHLGRFALGGAGLVFTEATAVQERGRRTHGDLGLWSDAHVDGLAAVTRFLQREGAVAGIQLAHAGRKASERRPWHGETPVDEEDIAQRGEQPWPAVGPSGVPYAEGWPAPAEMSAEDIREVIGAFRAAAERAREAGFRVIEVYAAHGFLLHQFYSPLANRRRDGYGGSLEGRGRLAAEVAAAIREVWPDEYPLVFRLSVTDWHPDGWQVDDTIHLARRLKDLGVDAIACSSGGIAGRERPQGMTLEQGYQLPLAAQVKKGAGIATIGVGLLWDPKLVNRALEQGDVDLVALARELLDNPNWTLHAARELGADQDHRMWHPEFGWWLEKRARAMRRLGLRSRGRNGGKN
ncbi:NADH:flavin oxidoreductase/NADH oxidase [Geodermatophilus chilensis]|uniref:NADH:flavin oxidoreductase/NADH oxidase n=1 Tax=Geodermatophilus chilensis TaxID=2035835 RepID=UPI000C25D251|nr:NADH:flavin oxidoreductase/NADH oxidase [Geodermatophilus chilensis]